MIFRPTLDNFIIFFFSLYCLSFNSLSIAKNTHHNNEQTIVEGSEQWHEYGRSLYNYRCYYCHGYSGNAKTLAATYMIPPPKDFTALSLASITRKEMLKVLKNGRDGTGMVSFSRYLNEQDMQAVVDFIRQEFMLNKKLNTLYHTKKNGWPNHQRYKIAYPFATGEIALDTPMTEMTNKQLTGYQLFMSSCVSCHDRAKVNDEGNIWQARSVSYPRNNFSYTQPDAISSASVFAQHDKKISIEPLNNTEKQGEKLYHDNCAFCHAADGTGKNWIGAFLDRAPRDLTDKNFMQGMTKKRLQTAISEGVINTSMPAWKSVLTQQQINQIISYIDRVFYPLVESD